MQSERRLGLRRATVLPRCPEVEPLLASLQAGVAVTHLLYKTAQTTLEPFFSAAEFSRERSDI